MLGILSIVATLFLSFTVIDTIKVPFDESSIFFIIFNNILLVGFVEESMKYLFLKLGTLKIKETNDQMAMIVY